MKKYDLALKNGKKKKFLISIGKWKQYYIQYGGNGKEVITLETSMWIAKNLWDFGLQIVNENIANIYRILV